MNVAKPFRALIGVYIKVIYSAGLVLTEVYTQTTTTAKTFTFINFLPMQNAKPAPSYGPGTPPSPPQKSFLCLMLERRSWVKRRHRGLSTSVSTQFLAGRSHSGVSVSVAVVPGGQTGTKDEGVEVLALPLVFPLVWSHSPSTSGG